MKFSAPQTNATPPPPLSVITHSAEVLLVLADPLHLWSVQHWYVVRHGLLSVFFVPFLLDQSTKSEEPARRRRFQLLGGVWGGGSTWLTMFFIC